MNCGLQKAKQFQCPVELFYLEWENDSFTSLQTSPHHMFFSYRETLSKKNHKQTEMGSGRSNQEEKGDLRSPL